MTLQEYINWMFTAKTEAAYICIGITAIFILAVLGEFLAGFRRGVGKQLFHLVLSAVALFVSFAITERLVTELHTLFSNYTIEDMVGYVESLINTPIRADIREALVGIDTHLAELILTLPMATLVAPVLFTVLYAIINLVVKIVYWTLGRLVPRGRNIASRGLGMIVGAVEGAVISALLLLPFMAFGQVMDGAAERIVAEGNNHSQIVEIRDEYIGPLNETPIFKLTGALGGDAMLDSFAKVDMGEGEVDLREEIYAAVDIVDAILEFGEADFSSLTDAQKAAITRMVDCIGDSELWSEIFAELLVSISGTSEGAPAEDGELMAVIVDDMMYIFSTSTGDNVGGDLNTFKELFFILSDEGVLTAFNGGELEALLDILASKDDEDQTVISRIMDTLSKNERTARVADSLMRLSVSIMADSLGLGEDAEQLYEDVKTGINKITDISYAECESDEEYEEMIAESLTETLAEQGITLSDKAISDMASHAADICKNNDFSELTDAQINDIILRYYESYASSVPVE